LIPLLVGLSVIKKPQPWLYYDAMNSKILSIKPKQNPECTCCGDNGFSRLGIGDFEITALELQDNDVKHSAKTGWLSWFVKNILLKKIF